jgi:hypothetical protein
MAKVIPPTIFIQRMDRISSCGRFAQQIVHEGAYDQQPKRIRHQGQSKYDVQPDADMIAGYQKEK